MHIGYQRSKHYYKGISMSFTLCMYVQQGYAFGCIGLYVYLYPSKAILQRLRQGYKYDILHTVHVYPFDV